MNNEKTITICYFGIFDPNLARNKIFISGLRKNRVNVIECYDNGRGLSKYIQLFIKHWKIRKEYDVMIVGYPGYMIAPFARMITRKPLIFDAFFSLYEQMVLSREPELINSLKSLFIRFIDKMAIVCSDIVLVESDSQKNYFIDRFKINKAKCQRIYTGADDTIFFPDNEVGKKSKFTVLFRGRMMPEAGIEYVIEAAKILRNDEIDFLIIGFGILEKRAEEMIRDNDLANVKFITRELEIVELRNKMLECHVSLGQFADHDRLNRTIPHKAYETIAMKMPYLTGDSRAVREFFVDRENCLMAKLADPEDLATKIKELKNDPDLMKKISENGYELFKKEFTPAVLGKQVMGLVNKLK